MRETNKAKQAFEDYFNLGPGRSLATLAAQYQRQKGTKQSPPTSNLRTLKTWSTKHGWQDRIAQREAEIAHAEFEAIKAKAVEAGFAYWPKRVQQLVKLGELLWEELNTESKRWLPDVKQIGSGKFAERVDLVRFNSALIEQYRKTLNDIALEMNERIKGFEMTWKQEAEQSGIPPSELFEHMVANAVAELSDQHAENGD